MKPRIVNIYTLSMSVLMLLGNCRKITGLVSSVAKTSANQRTSSRTAAERAFGTITSAIQSDVATHSTRLYSSTASPQDDSAMSKSRAPFRMPRDSPDDSVPQAAAKTNLLAWNQLGLWTELVEAMARLELQTPTPVQQLAIPELLKEPPQHLAFLAATGSGKTLAYALPLLQMLKQGEVFADYERRPKRPRLLILVPTRELVVQITSVIKSVSHSIKLSSCSITGGEDYGVQRRQLNRPIDVVVATPGRLTKHWKDSNLFLGSLEHIVVDEMDTMLEQGFYRELRQLLYPVLYHKQADQEINVEQDLDAKAPRIVLTSATMTQQIQKIIGDSDNKKNLVNAKRHHRKVEDAGFQVKVPMVLPRTKVLKAAGLHKTVPRLQQVFVDVGATDKLSLLVDIVSSGGSGAAVAASLTDQQALTMIFCNTAASCRAAQFALSEARIESLAYHGDLNSAMRSENLKRFRAAGKKNCDNALAEEPRVLVCTDLAARGLDVPQVDHIVMFDFPLNALDYLHRSGRTARGVGGDRTGNGRVTALISKRDKVLANAIEQAVLRGDTLDGLSSRKSDYLPGARLGNQGRPVNKKNTARRGGGSFAQGKNEQKRKSSSSRGPRR